MDMGLPSADERMRGAHRVEDDFIGCRKLPHESAAAQFGPAGRLHTAPFQTRFLAWLVYLLLAQVGVLARPWVAALSWFFILFVPPAALGAASGLLGQRTAVRRLLARYGIYTLPPRPAEPVEKRATSPKRR